MEINIAFASFQNASITVTRSQGQRTAAGFEQTSTQDVLQCRGDAQESGRSLERAQQLYETGDVLFFAEVSVTNVTAGDSVALDLDNGRMLEGSVEQVMQIDSSLLIAL